MLVFLIGFMGSGKSSIGQATADQLSVPFYDTDKLIEESLQKTVTTIFNEYGEAYFRKCEYDILQIFDASQNGVVSTGGGLPCLQYNLDLMKKLGVVIFLDCPVEVLLERLANNSDRPLLQNQSKEDLVGFITNKLAERRVYYEQAHMVFTADTELEANVKDLSKYLSMFL